MVRYESLDLNWTAQIRNWEGERERVAGRHIGGAAVAQDSGRRRSANVGDAG
jgi:hypothetical protein